MDNTGSTLSTDMDTIDTAARWYEKCYLIFGITSNLMIRQKSFFIVFSELFYPGEYFLHKRCMGNNCK